MKILGWNRTWQLLKSSLDCQFIIHQHYNNYNTYLFLMAPISNQPKCNTLGVVKVLANIIFGPDGNTVERQLSELLSETSDCFTRGYYFLLQLSDYKHYYMFYHF